MKRLAFAALLHFGCLFGCRKETPTVALTDSAISPAPSAQDAQPKDTEPKTTRIKGSLEGGFAVDRLQFVAGAPIIVTFLATNTGTAPMEFDVGGDSSGALFPIRYGLVVRDAQGAEVCNLAKSQPTGTGGLASSRSLKVGDRYREKFALNGACEGLLTPGKYTVTFVRRFDTLIAKDAGSCDPMLPGEVVPASASPACRTLFEASPLIASDVKLEVVPYDPKAIATTLEPIVSEAKTAKDLGGHYERLSYFQWLCRRVTCECKPPTKPEELAPFMSAIVAKLPAAIPSKCP